jgi:transcriptional regulator with XRE-family HTH domain
MSTAVSTSNTVSLWQSWSLGTEDFCYSATGAGASVPRGSVRPGWVAAAMLATLAASAGIKGSMAFKSLVGTGGSGNYLISEDRTEATLTESWEGLFERIGGQATKGTSVVLAGADLIAEIKTTLGVSVTDLAFIAGVSRQAIYDWIGGGQVSGANYERLLELSKVCMDWRSLANRPIGRLLRTKSAEGHSLLDLLRQDPLDRSLVAPQLEALAARAAEQDKQRKVRNSRLVALSEKDQYENALTHAIPATRS